MRNDRFDIRARSRYAPAARNHDGMFARLHALLPMAYPQDPRHAYRGVQSTVASDRKITRGWLMVQAVTASVSASAGVAASASFPTARYRLTPKSNLNPDGLRLVHGIDRSIQFPVHSIPIPFHSVRPFLPFHSIHSIPFHSILPFHSIPGFSRTSMISSALTQRSAAGHRQLLCAASPCSASTVNPTAPLTSLSVSESYRAQYRPACDLNSNCCASAQSLPSSTRPASISPRDALPA